MNAIENHIPEVTVTELVSQLTAIYSAAIQGAGSLDGLPAPFLWGPPGIGKSDCVTQLAQALRESVGKRVHVTDIRLLLFSPIDLRGIPVADSERTFTNWLKPKIFDMDPAEDCINLLFLDELSAAPPAVQAAAYQITLNRAIGEHALPENCIVLAAGNRTTDRSVAFRMPSALANRLMHFQIKVDFAAWKEWAMAHDVHGFVLGYLNFDPSKLMQEDVGLEQTAFPTPRSWMFVSGLLHVLGTQGDLSRLFAPVAGCVGTGTAAEFIRWCTVCRNLPDAETIFKGGEARYPQTPDEIYTLIMIMLDYVKRREVPKLQKGVSLEELSNAVDYVMGFPPDYQTCLYSSLCRMDTVKKRLLQVPLFMEWLKERSGSELQWLLEDL